MLQKNVRLYKWSIVFITCDFLFLFQKWIQISLSNGPPDQNVVLGKRFGYILSSEMRHYKILRSASKFLKKLDLGWLTWTQQIWRCFKYLSPGQVINLYKPINKVAPRKGSAGHVIWKIYIYPYLNLSFHWLKTIQWIIKRKHLTMMPIFQKDSHSLKAAASIRF